MKILVTQHLVAPQSPKKAFYKLNVVQCHENAYHVVKQSGIQETVLDQRIWVFDDSQKAIRFFSRKLREKLNPNRKSPRKYVIVE